METRTEAEVAAADCTAAGAAVEDNPACHIPEDLFHSSNYHHVRKNGVSI